MPVVTAVLNSASEVRLEFEVDEEYDPALYATELIRACESVVSPLGWDR